MSVATISFLFFGATFLLLLSGMPVAFALGAVSLIFMFCFLGAPDISGMAETVYGELNNFALLTIPMFVLMGAAIGKTRAGGDLYNSLHRWLYKVPGGLGVANVLACTVFAALCGSSPATCSAIGSMGIPEMRKRGYSPELASGIIAAGGTLGILIPPSITLIIYGLASSTSIGQLFLAGFGPGLLLSSFFCVYTVWAFRRERERARLAVAQGGGDAAAAELLKEEHYSWRDRLESLPRLLPFIVLVAIIMAALYGGWATPSELAGIGAFCSILLVVALYACWRWTDMKVILRGTVRESTMIMLIIAMAALYTYVMNRLQISQAMAQWLVALPLDKWTFFIGVNVLFIILGCFLPPVAIIVMITPIIMPAMLARGFDPVWFGIIMTILLEMGLIHPPVGLNIFVINGIAPDITFWQIVRGILPFLGLMAACIAVLSFFPRIATWLPDQVYKKEGAAPPKKTTSLVVARPAWA